MIIEFKVNETTVEAAWLKTLYDLIEELNCKCKTFLEETHNKSYKNYQRTRIVEIYGSDTMISWLKLRMERYSHFIDRMTDMPEIRVLPDKEE